MSNTEETFLDALRLKERFICFTLDDSMNQFCELSLSLIITIFLT